MGGKSAEWSRVDRAAYISKFPRPSAQVHKSEAPMGTEGRSTAAGSKSGHQHSNALAAAPPHSQRFAFGVFIRWGCFIRDVDCIRVRL